VLAPALLLQREFDSAVQQATNALKVRRNWRPAITTALCCCRAMRQKDGARQCVQRVARCEPSADALAPLWRTNARWREEMTSWLRQAIGIALLNVDIWPRFERRSSGWNWPN